MVNLQLSFVLTLVVLAGAVTAPASSGDTRVYHQNADNSIGELAVSGPFTTEHVYFSTVRIPAAEILPGTPIATALLGDNFAELHVFFVSPVHVLSEWIWNAAAVAWHGGPTCHHRVAG
ncbi:hypothetical protein B0H14DRAFT_3493803 [Mycena olivaceomarginata]|nr:hypothetical protein B0H14DRAFT_3493803 [Mycena olivaceomarginata]